MRVVSYNIHRAIGVDRQRDPARIASVINQLEADVIGLQEVDWHHDHNDETSQFEYLAHMPGYCAVAGANLLDHRGHYGNLLLTRLTVQAVRQIDLSQGGREPRGAIDVDLGTVGSRFLRVIVTHLGLGTRERRRQAARLGDALAARPHQPTLLLGDFNDWVPGSPSLRPLTGLCGATGRPASYPAFWPVLALDRILASALPSSPRIRTHASPLARKASDHLPIVAEIDTGTLGIGDGTAIPLRRRGADAPSVGRSPEPARSG